MKDYEFDVYERKRKQKEDRAISGVAAFIVIVLWIAALGDWI